MFSVIYIPDFALQAVLRSEPELYSRPVALIGEPQPKPIICQLTVAARIAGVELNMTPTQAMARCGHILIRTRSIAQEKAANEALLQCAYGFSPAFEATAPGVCTLDLKGLRNAGGAEFGEKIVRALAQLHLNAQVGVAENPILAFHAARQARPFLAVKDRHAFLAPLPIETIDPPSPISGILKKWGISTLGQFTALGRDQIAERLGAEALELFERACANATRPLHLANPPETFEETIDLEHEIESLEPLLFILRRFIEQISRRLELAHWVAQSIQLRLLFIDGNHYERTFKIPAPTRQIETLFRMLHTHLENLRTDCPVIGLNLSAKPCHVENHQFGLFETAFRDPNHFYETLARLTALLGADRIGIPTLECTHRPDAFHLEGPRTKDQRPKTKDQGPGTLFGLSLRRFRPALPVEIQVEQQQPVYLKSSNYKGQIAKAQGPWRTSGDWWDNRMWQREEWDVQTSSGILFRVCQQGGEWFLEGVYD